MMAKAVPQWEMKHSGTLLQGRGTFYFLVQGRGTFYFLACKEGGHSTFLAV